MARSNLPKSMKLHLYCHGLGDCMVLEFPRADDDDRPYWMLIDCGIHTSAKGGSGRLREVVEDIHDLTKGKLDVVVMTHEHWDHNSGFHTARDVFAKFDVGAVWFSWAENPEDPQAQQLDKFKGEAEQALAGSTVELALAASNEDISPRFGVLSGGVESLLGFVFGVKGERSRGAREAARGLAPNNVSHFNPGDIADLPKNVPGFRIHVLAPPRDEKLLKIKDRKSETYVDDDDDDQHGVSAIANAVRVNQGLMSANSDPYSPFADNAGITISDFYDGTLKKDKRPAADEFGFFSTHYAGPAVLEKRHGKGDDHPTPDQQWRRIDGDWLSSASNLALQMDSKTNNSSLVLAIEIEATGRTLIFAADAQVGNWKSWADVEFTYEDAQPPKTVTGADLLKRAIFYKVGHHGSRNATLREGGLELMTDPRLSAFIPTDEKMAKKVRWHDMPASGLLKRLLEKTDGRTIPSDAPWLRDGTFDDIINKDGSIKSIKTKEIGAEAAQGDMQNMRLTLEIE